MSPERQRLPQPSACWWSPLRRMKTSLPGSANMPAACCGAADAFPCWRTSCDDARPGAVGVPVVIGHVHQIAFFHLHDRAGKGQGLLIGELVAGLGDALLLPREFVVAGEGGEGHELGRPACPWFAVCRQRACPRGLLCIHVITHGVLPPVRCARAPSPRGAGSCP